MITSSNIIILNHRVSIAHYIILDTHLKIFRTRIFINLLILILNLILLVNVLRDLNDSLSMNINIYRLLFQFNSYKLFSPEVIFIKVSLSIFNFLLSLLEYIFKSFHSIIILPYYCSTKEFESHQ